MNEKEYGMSRDALYKKLKQNDIFCRRYFFYPLISDSPIYRDLPSSAPDGLPAAHKMANEVICLPIYAELEMKNAEMVCDRIKEAAA